MGGQGKRDGGKGSGGKNRPRKHAFKFLCPEGLITSVMGPRGTTKDQIEEETGCRLIFSGREEFFPHTRFRLLNIYSYDAESIVPVVDRLLEHIVQNGQHEANPPKGEADFVCKDPGTYVMRAAVSVRMSREIIGPRGTTIQGIRDQSGAKVFIDKYNYQGHQLLKCLGSPEAVRASMLSVSELVQADAGSDEFMEWSSIKTISAEEQGEDVSFQKGKDMGKGRGQGPGKSGKGGAGTPALPWRGKPGGDGGRDRERSPRRGGDWEAEPPAEAAAEDGAEAEEDRQAGPGQADGELAPEGDAAVLQRLQATVDDFPEGSLGIEYTVTCDLPQEKVGKLIGKRGENIKAVREQTGVRIHFNEPSEGQQTLLITGPLLRVYKAHALMMKRYHEVEVEADQLAAMPSVTELQEQLQTLQKQLELVQGAIPAAGKGKGKKA